MCPVLCGVSKSGCAGHTGADETHRDESIIPGAAKYEREQPQKLPRPRQGEREANSRARASLVGQIPGDHDGIAFGANRSIAENIYQNLAATLGIEVAREGRS